MHSPRIAQVRRATPGIAAAVGELLAQLSPDATDLDVAQLRAVLRQPNFILLAAWDRGRIVGVASVYVETLMMKRTAWIEDVVVDQAARGRGIGQALVDALIAVARDRGAAEVNLTSRPERVAANALYQKLGFEKRSTNVYRLSLRP